MKFYYLILLSIIITGCGSKIKDSSIVAQSVINDSLLPVDCIPANLITRLGTKVMYTRVGNAVKLCWGDDTYTRSHDSLFTCEDSRFGRWDFIPKFLSETKHNLVFKNVLSTSSGGNPAPIDFSVIVFPKNMKDSVYEKEMYIDKHGDYLVYIAGWKADSLAVLNIESKRTQICRLSPDPLPFARSPTFIIKKTKIKDQAFFVEYEGLDEKDSTIILKNKFKLNI
jgi:hypothetical protein